MNSSINGTQSTTRPPISSNETRPTPSSQAKQTLRRTAGELKEVKLEAQTRIAERKGEQQDNDEVHVSRITRLFEQTISQLENRVEEKLSDLRNENRLLKRKTDAQQVEINRLTEELQSFRSTYESHRHDTESSAARFMPGPAAGWGQLRINQTSPPS
ncbi:MAG: hypothetical protein ACH350_07700 [Parachlamydiaceae bacterium]